MKVLANDGIATSGVVALENAGFEVILKTVAQEQLADFINENKVDVESAVFSSKQVLGQRIKEKGT